MFGYPSYIGYYYYNQNMLYLYPLNKSWDDFPKPEDVCFLDFSYKNFESLPDLSKFINLKQLNCVYNNLKYLPLELNNLKKIKHIYFDYNKLISLPVCIKHCKSLEYYNKKYDIPDYKYLNNQPYLINKLINKYYDKAIIDYYNSKYL